MKVYRLERNGIGPFIDYVPRKFKLTNGKSRRARHVFSQVKPPKDSHDRHMMAVRDSDHVFGTPSKELLKAYFGYSLKEFFRQGFRIHTYEVPDDKVIHMGYEVAFPVQYHKFKTYKRLEAARDKIKVIRM
jgi:hypothetical protein